MRIGIVAFQVAVIQPQHALLCQPCRQIAAQRFARALRVTLMQALPGGQQCAGTIGLDRTAFQGEVDGPYLRRHEHLRGIQRAHQLIVQAGVELAAPAGEAEIHQAEAGALAQRDRAGIAQPGVVVCGDHETHARHVHPRRAQSRLGVDLQVVVGHADHHWLEAGDRRDQCDIGLFHIGQALGPIGTGMRPREQHGGLRFPLGGKTKTVGHARQMLILVCGPSPARSSISHRRMRALAIQARIGAPGLVTESQQRPSGC